MKDGEQVHVAVCNRCGPVCVSGDKKKADARADQHKLSAGAFHKVYVSTIGYTSPDMCEKDSVPE
jgi:hypothetical protein